MAPLPSSSMSSTSQDPPNDAPLRNVNGRYAVRPERVVRPRDLAALQAFVRGTTPEEARRPLKVVGGRYSLSSVALPSREAVVLDLGHLDTIGVPRDGQITVGAGATLRALLDVLRSAGLQTGVVPLAGNFTLGAICGTPFYESSVHTGTHAYFSTDVLEYKLVLADGSLRTVAGEDELAFFLRTHQGLLGIVYEITLRVYPLQMHRVRFGTRSVDAHLKSNLEDPSPQAQRETLWVFPPVTSCGSPTTADPTTRFGRRSCS